MGIRTYYIVKLEVPMHDGIAVAGKILPYIVDYLVVVFVGTSKFFAGLDVFDLCLLSFNPAECVAVSGVEIRFLPISFQANGVRIQGMKPGKRFDGREPTDHIIYQHLHPRVWKMSWETYAWRRSEGDKSPRSGSVIIRPLTNSIT